MKSKTKEKLVVALIKDHLISTKLISGLTKLGLQADEYYLHLSKTIFKLMGIKDEKHAERLHEHYFILLGCVEQVDIIKEKDRLNGIARDIYQELLLVKPS